MWWQMFVNRYDAYATQEIVRGKCQYFSKYHSVTPEIFEAHLAGAITLGLPALDEHGFSRWCCFDSDYEDGALERIEQWLLAHHYRCHRESQRPGRAGHLWTFFQEPLPASDLRLFAHRVATLSGSEKTVEIFPKQDCATWDAEALRFKISSIVRLPLGINRKLDAYGGRGWFDGVEQNLLSQILWLECLQLNPVTPILDAAPALQRLAQAKQLSSNSRGNFSSLGTVDVERILEALRNISPDQYHVWCKVGMALKAGGFELPVWEAWSAKSAKYSAGECQRKWATFHGDKIGIGTIFHFASNPP